ncbi:MAG: DHA2 family efflux MFS transporter permease subunit [Pseudonocardiaceae bacterium]|nr:DHA2 family efflux MFS transporter permease subunit [Pseudonocardiaceae bacterium]
MTEPNPPTISAGGSGSDKLDRRILAIGSVVVLGAIMAMLDITVVNVAINHLIGEFDTTLDTIQWVATGYTLALATVIPLSGWAADRFGTKRIYLTAVFLFMVGSALAGMAWSVESLIVFRVLQGLGGGMLMPIGMTILTKAAGPDRVGRIMAVLGVPMLLGPIVGPILGGWLVDDVSWRWIFFVNVPVGVVALFLGARILDRDQPRPTERLDVLGLILLSPGLAALIYGLAQVPSHGGFGHAEVYLPAVIGAALVAAFVWHAARTEHALIDLKLFRDRGFTVASAAMVLFSVAFFGTMLLFPLYFQQVRGEGALAAGVLFTRLEADTSYWALGAALFVLGIGTGMTMMPLMSAALKTLRQENVARASTSLNILQQVSASIGTAMLSVILFNEITDRLPPVPPGGPAQSSSTQDLPDAVREQLAPALSDAYSYTFVWALVLLAVAILPVLLLPRGKAAGGTASAETAPEPEKASEVH